MDLLHVAAGLLVVGAKMNELAGDMMRKPRLSYRLSKQDCYCINTRIRRVLLGVQLDVFSMIARG